MTYIANNVNHSQPFFQLGMDEKEWVAHPPKTQKEVLPVGETFIDSNLLCGGVERGRILNIEAFDKYAKKAIYYFTCKIAQTNKKIAVVVPYEADKKFAKDIVKYVTPNLGKEAQKNVKIYGLACGLHGIFDFFKNEKSKFDFILIYDLWRKSNSLSRVRDAAYLASKTNSAFIVISPLKAPTTINNYRDKEYPAFQTILKHCQCNVLARPILRQEKIFLDENEMVKVWAAARNSGCYRLPSEMVFIQKDAEGNVYTEKQLCAFTRGSLNRNHTLLCFTFGNETRTPPTPKPEPQILEPFYEIDLFSLASETR